MSVFNSFKPTFLAITCLTGCTFLESNPQSILANTNHVLELDRVTNPENDIRDYSLFTPRNSNISLNDYVEQMVMDFRFNGPFNTPIAIASFVEFDETLTKTNSLGNQLSEAFLIKMTQAGYPVADINTSNWIVLNTNGSFVFTRQQEDDLDNICCALSGNLIYQSNGVRVNSKVFNMQTKRVIAASSTVIPYFVVEHLGQAQKQ
jgi:TolB-like protein